MSATVAHPLSVMGDAQLLRPRYHGAGRPASTKYTADDRRGTRSPECQCLEDVGTAADAAVEIDLRLAADGLDDAGQRADARPGGVPSCRPPWFETMTPSRPRRRTAPRVCAHDPLDHERTLPHAGIRSMSSHATRRIETGCWTYSVGVSPVPAAPAGRSVANVMCGVRRKPATSAGAEPLDERLGRHAGRTLKPLRMSRSA